jgi:hypothetical protein
MASVRARPSLLPRLWRGRVGQLIARRRRLMTALLVGVATAGVPSPVIASSGGGRRITDAENTRTVYLVVAALVLLAVGLAVFTWWFWRSTRRDHEALAPLEVMSDRKFVARDGVTRQVLLDVNRPLGAAPLAPGAPEPLLLPADDDGATETDGAPATLVVAAVGVGAAAEGTADGEAVAAAGPAEPAASSNGDATTVIDVQDGTTPDDEPMEADGVDGDATMAIDVAAVETPVAAEPLPAEPSAPVSPEDDAPPAVATNGSAPVPIDPGLPVPPADEEPVRHLSLAELAALGAASPVRFDENELASTPSTGIPIIESAEAWLERQLTGANGGPVNGNGNGDHVDDAASAADDDPDEPTPAAVRGAE